MFPTSQPYNSHTEQQAVEWVQQHVNAGMGGTEIYKALHSVYSVPVLAGYQRKLLFLTDGGNFGDEERVCQMIDSSKSTCLPSARDTVSAEEHHIRCEWFITAKPWCSCQGVSFSEARSSWAPSAFSTVWSGIEIRHSMQEGARLRGAKGTSCFVHQGL
jgi:hypothetical protein